MRIHTVPGLFERWFADLDELGAETARAFRPAVDVLEFAEHYEVVADLPGIEQKSIEVEFTEGAIQIRGERVEALPDEARVYRKERPVGKFGRSIGFGNDVDSEGIEASFKDGVLRVRVPKSARNKPRQIPVSVH